MHTKIIKGFLLSCKRDFYRLYELTRRAQAGKGFALRVNLVSRTKT
jgi:hypothetical protein